MKMKKKRKNVNSPVHNSKMELLKRSKMVLEMGGYNLLQLKVLKP